MRSQNAVLIYNSAFISAGFDFDIAHKERNLVLFIQAIPEQLRKAVDISLDSHKLGFTLETGKRTAVLLISMDKPSLTGFRILIGISKAVTGGRIALIAL